MTMRSCECGCGRPLPPGAHGKRRYLDGHRDRSYRQRLRAAAEARGLPGRLTFETVQTTSTTQKASADAQPRRRRATRGPRPGVQAYFQPGSAEAALDALNAADDSSPALALAREALEAAIDRRKRRQRRP
jgi:hypothetical protein